MEFALVLILGLIAGTLGGVIGFGTSIIVMPALVLVFGPQEAVPVMAVASVMANASRVAAWWREVDWRAVAAYGVPGLPAAALGAATLLVLPVRAVEAVLGVFFIAMIPARRWMARRKLRLRLPHLALAGAGIGFLTGIVASTGPINAPFFLAYGLVKGAYLGTEAMGSLVGLHGQGSHLPQPGGAAAGNAGPRPHHRQLADGRRLHRQALRGPARSRTGSAC